MATYEYTARNAQGQETTGTMEAASRDEVVANLRKNRMVLVRLREAKRAKRGGSVPTNATQRSTHSSRPASSATASASTKSQPRIGRPIMSNGRT